jgi:sulfoxide reductase heme-binding subunit YedZ
MALWYLTRATGVVALLLVTLTLVLGVLDVGRFSSPRLPRFAIDAIHRSASLLVIVFVAVHVLMAVIDSYAPVRLADAVVPFGGTYRPLWVGLGALSFDLLLALVITSLLRARLGVRAWRIVHWAAYACWPLALLHGLGTGSDVKPGWFLWLSIACSAVVALAILSRAPKGIAQVSVVTALAVGALGLAVWLPTGPLGSGWAAKAGTPSALLHGGAR